VIRHLSHSIVIFGLPQQPDSLARRLQRRRKAWAEERCLAYSEEKSNAHWQCVVKMRARGKGRLMESNEDLRAAGREIRRHRQSLGLSQEQLAERAGLHRNYVGFLERGERNASLKTLFAVARSLGISLGELLAGVSAEAKHRRESRVEKR